MIWLIGKEDGAIKFGCQQEIGEQLGIMVTGVIKEIGETKELGIKELGEIKVLGTKEIGDKKELIEKTNKGFKYKKSLNSE